MALIYVAGISGAGKPSPAATTTAPHPAGAAGTAGRAVHRPV